MLKKLALENKNSIRTLNTLWNNTILLIAPKNFGQKWTIKAEKCNKPDSLCWNPTEKHYHDQNEKLQFLINFYCVEIYIGTSTENSILLIQQENNIIMFCSKLNVAFWFVQNYLTQYFVSCWESHNCYMYWYFSWPRNNKW